MAAKTDGLNIDFTGVAPTDQARLSNSFTSALQALSCVWPGMAETVRRHIATVIVHRGATTTSHRYFAGTVVFSSRDLERSALGAEASICECLVHEATHQTLYCLQEEGPLILPPDGSRFASPWSGAERSLLLAAHIAPVYFVIIEYLYRLRRSGRGDDAATIRRLGEILAGMDRFFDQGIGRSYLTPRGLALHTQIEAAIRDRRDAYLS